MCAVSCSLIIFSTTRTCGDCRQLVAPFALKYIFLRVCFLHLRKCAHLLQYIIIPSSSGVAKIYHHLSTHFLLLFQELPKVVDGGQKPLAQEPPIVNEEFDLSDVLGEQLDSHLETKEERLRQLQQQVHHICMQTQMQLQYQPSTDNTTV